MGRGGTRQFGLEAKRGHHRFEPAGVQGREQLRVNPRRIDPRPPVDDPLTGPGEVRRAARIRPDRLEQRILHAGIMRGQGSAFTQTREEVPLLAKGSHRREGGFLQAVHRGVLGSHPPRGPAQTGGARTNIRMRNSLQISWRLS